MDAHGHAPLWTTLCAEAAATRHADIGEALPRVVPCILYPVVRVVPCTLCRAVPRSARHARIHIRVSTMRRVGVAHATLRVGRGQARVAHDGRVRLYPVPCAPPCPARARALLLPVPYAPLHPVPRARALASRGEGRVREEGPVPCTRRVREEDPVPCTRRVREEAPVPCTRRVREEFAGCVGDVATLTPRPWIQFYKPCMRIEPCMCIESCMCIEPCMCIESCMCSEPCMCTR